MSSITPSAAERAAAREAERQRAREERKAEVAKRRTKRGGSDSRENSDEEEDPNDPLAAERKAWKERQRKNAAANGSASTDDAAAASASGDAGDQLLAKAQSLQQENRAVLQNTVRVARETTSVGAETIHKLHEQSEQFARMENALDDTNDTLSRSERILRGMKSIGGAISKWKADGKRGCVEREGACVNVSHLLHLYVSLSLAANFFTSDKTKKPKPVISSRADANFGDLNRSVTDAHEDARSEWATTRATPSASAASSSSALPSPLSSTRANDPGPTPKQANALAIIEQNKREEDEALDELSDVLHTLKGQSQAIQQQLAVQDKQVDRIESKVDNTSSRLAKNVRTMKKIT